MHKPTNSIFRVFGGEYWRKDKKMKIYYHSMVLFISVFHFVNSSNINIPKIIEKDVKTMETLSSIKRAFDRRMIQSEAQNSDDVDYRDFPFSAHSKFGHNAKKLYEKLYLSNFQGHGRGNNSHDNDTDDKLVSTI